ncbi:zinc finger and BTB domain-containing protein 41-like [Trichogramma pretiosum]|uniref:zinc finger and BTB domain-containing protein 41-like n=1 Tax=Trichogramma pretiosum TaxID=7493 RepID=UPI000C719829|nr:zinc finger and BTB domain-containing protein 41-like [Trichogramma pretiosum]
MDAKQDTVRIKKEPNDSWSDVDNEDNFDSVDSFKTEKFPFYKLAANKIKEGTSKYEKSDEKIFIDFECKDVKPETRSSSTTICKSEDKNDLPIVKIENQIQTNYLNEKKVIILIKKGFNYDNNYRFQEIDQLKLDESDKVKIFKKRTETKLSLCRKIYKGKVSLQAHIDTTHKNIRPLHNRSKPVECGICHKSFGYRNTLKSHKLIAHNLGIPIKCEICHKSFRVKQNLKNHIDTIQFMIAANLFSVKFAINHLDIRMNSKATN